jgi:hypothetical protein
LGRNSAHLCIGEYYDLMDKVDEGMAKWEMWWEGIDSTSTSSSRYVWNSHQRHPRLK